MKQFTKQGKWFLPDTPNVEVDGELVYAPTQYPYLKLRGVLHDHSEINNYLAHEEIPVIHGHFLDGKPVTLFNCYKTGSLKTGVQEPKIYCEYIIVGHHFFSIETMELSGISVRYYYLEKWLNQKNFSILGTPHDSLQETFKEITIKQTINDPIVIGKINDFEINLYDKPTFTPDHIKLLQLFGLGDHKVTLYDTKELVIRSEKKSLDDYIKIVEFLQNFLTFASGQCIYPCEVTSYLLIDNYKITPECLLRIRDYINSQEPKKENDNEILSIPHNLVERKENKEPIQLEIYYRLAEKNIFNDDFDAKKVLFYFRDMEDKSDIILNAWFEYKEKLESIFDLYLRLIYIPGHRNNYFLSLAQAIEGFHRIHHIDNYFDRELYKNKILPKIKENLKLVLKEMIDSELEMITLAFLRGVKILGLSLCWLMFLHKWGDKLESIINKTAYLNEYSLKERLEDLLAFYDDCLPLNLFNSQSEKDKFPKKIRDTRGDLTHPHKNQEKSNKNVVYDTGLDTLIRKLKILLEICLLKTLSFESTSVTSIIQRKYNL